jgi:hypothetical protein
MYIPIPKIKGAKKKKIRHQKFVLSRKKCPPAE